MDAMKQVLAAKVASRHLSRAEYELAGAVEKIAEIISDEEAGYHPKDMHSVYARLANLIQSLEGLVSNSDAAVWNPENLREIREIVVDHAARSISEV